MTDTIRYIPRYIRNTDAFGWQGADSPDGPWRSITPPQSSAPWQTTSPMDALPQTSAEVSGAKMLSPAAQAVLDAATERWLDVDDDIPAQVTAAALRAAADRARRGPEHWEGSYPDDYDNGWNEAVDYLTTIATELEGIND